MAQVRESDGMPNGTNKGGKGCNPPIQTKAPQVEEGDGAAAKTNQGGKGGRFVSDNLFRVIHPGGNGYNNSHCICSLDA